MSFYSGACGNDQQDGQARGGAGGGERPGRGGQGVHEGHGRHQHVQEHERDSRWVRAETSATPSFHCSLVTRCKELIHRAFIDYLAF